MLTASTAARAPKRLGLSMPTPPETMRTSAVQCRGGFRKKVFGPPPCSEVEKGGTDVRSSRKTYFRKSRRELHPAVSDIPRSQIWARSASPPPKWTLRPHALTLGATQAMVTAERARGLAHEEPRDTAPILQPPRLLEIDAITGCGGGEPSNSLASAHMA